MPNTIISVIRLIFFSLTLTFCHANEPNASDIISAASSYKGRSSQTFTSLSAANRNEKKPHFVLNTIAHIPNPFTKTDLSRELRDRAKNLDYYVDKSTRGKLDSEGARHQNDLLDCHEEACSTCTQLEPFVNKLLEESFSQDKESSQKEAQERLAVAILCNRMKSVDQTLNLGLLQQSHSLPRKIQHKIKTIFWEPRWMKRELVARQKKHPKASFSEVKKFYGICPKFCVRAVCVLLSVVLLKFNHKPIHSCFPVMNWHCPFFCNIVHG